MLIKFSRKKWWAIENNWLFEHWYAIYRKVFLCFYKKVGDVSIHFFDNCKDGKAVDALLEQTFQTKGVQHEEDPCNNGHRHSRYKRRRCRKAHSEGMPIGQTRGAAQCATYSVDTMPRFEMNAVMISLGSGKFVIYNLAGWSIQISN